MTVIGDTGSIGQHVLSPVEVEVDTEFVHVTILFQQMAENHVPERCIKPTRIVMHSTVLVGPVSKTIDLHRICAKDILNLNYLLQNG